MKRIFLLAGLSLCLASVCAAQRLPELAVPDNYKLAFAPDFTKNNFTGDETIKVRLLKPTSEIVLNAAEIDFDVATITSGGASQKAKVTLDKEKEMATLTVANAIQPGPATIQIRYAGILNDQLRGFYMGKDSDGRKYAATQFEATDARRAFPSFDEPAYKATFDVVVTADQGMTVISNTKVVSDTPGPGDGKHTVAFATTPKMSSYLVAMVVGNFEYIEGSADGIPIRVYASPGKKELGTFALDAAENIMRYYNRYFAIKYPYGKLDLIGLADFSAGAMENTGCITFREILLLVDDKHVSLGLKKEVASVIAHEMAHQWFGDLVTMKWWDDIWLNEGFATWMSSKPVEAWKPEWNMDLDDVRETGDALNADSLVNTHPIHQQAETPQEILELADDISYGKTAAVLRMLEAYLGPETFRAGVNSYLKQHAYANATASDFWSAQTQISKKPVDKIMPTFVEQPGPPLVSVKNQCSGNSTTVGLAQQRYFYDRDLFNAGSKELWQIPACVKTSKDAGAEKCELLVKKEQALNLPGCSTWILANVGAKGYYRSGYESEAVRSMAKDVETALTPAERIRLLSDIWASVRVNREPIGDYLAVAQGLQTDRTSAVLSEMISQLDYIGEHLVNDSDRESYELWVRQLLTPAAKEVGWEAKPGESPDQRSLRARLLHALGYTARDPEVEAVARKLTDQALQDPSSVDRELLFGALPVAARNGDSALYDTILARVKSAKTPEEEYLYQQILSRFSDPKLLERTLEYAISPDVRSQDSLRVISGVMRNPAGTKLAWDFVRAHWNEIANLGGAFGGGMIVENTSSFCDAGMRDEVKDFFAAHHAPAAERSLKQSLERINYCVDLKAQQGTQLASWLQTHGSAAGE
ncbi:MAG TPA: M1 family metallopeptidase [Terriglobales bacterium]|nr:M1 family metallopeptidase [Terriglobales bacterium]